MIVVAKEGRTLNGAGRGVVVGGTEGLRLSLQEEEKKQGDEETREGNQIRKGLLGCFCRGGGED